MLVALTTARSVQIPQHYYFLKSVCIVLCSIAMTVAAHGSICTSSPLNPRLLTRIL